jgi:hypothetical protein
MSTTIIKASRILDNIEEHALRYTDTLALRIIRNAYLYLEDPEWYTRQRKLYSASSTDSIFNPPTVNAHVHSTFAQALNSWASIGPGMCVRTGTGKKRGR